jgi:5-methylcytosine-specific restriction endonuclease McrA
MVIKKITRGFKMYNKEWRRNNRRKLRMLHNAESGVCEKCHSVFDISQLTVHHIIPKQYNVFINFLFERDVMKDIQKYGILCQKCHNEVEEIYKLHPAKVILSYMNKAHKNSVLYQTLNVIEKTLSITEDDVKNIFLKSCLFYKKLYDYILEDKIRFT